MKKLLQTLATLTLLLSFSLAHASSINGILLDENREGVPDHPIELTFHNPNVPSVTVDLVTDSVGRFSQGIPRGFETGGAILFRYEDCNRDTIEKRFVLPPVVPPNRIFRLPFCKDGNTGNDCAVRVQSRPTNSGDVHLTAIARGARPFQYEWSNGDTTQTTTVPQNSDYCVTMTDATGCMDRFCNDDVDSCAVKIIRAPGNPNDSSFQLIALFRPGGDSVSYAWDTGDSTRVVDISGPGTYCVTATNQDGCSASSCITIPERDSSCLEAEFVVTRDSSGQFVVLSVSHDPNLDLTYLWNTGDTTREINVDQSGMYVVRIFNPEDSCIVVRRTFVRLDQCKVKILMRLTAQGIRLTAITPGPPNQNVEFEWSTGETTRSILIRDLNRRYCVTAIYPNCRARDCIIPRINRGPHSISIRPFGLNDDDELILVAESPKEMNIIWEDGTEGPYFTPPAPGTYTAYGIDSDGKQSHSTFRLSSADLDQAPGQNMTEIPDFQIYPNPAQDRIQLGFDVSPSTTTSIIIYNMSGRIMKEVPSQKLANQRAIDISNLAPGMYILELRSGDTARKQKFVVN